MIPTERLETYFASHSGDRSVWMREYAPIIKRVAPKIPGKLAKTLNPSTSIYIVQNIVSGR